jgi:hypothetical protein
MVDLNCGARQPHRPLAVMDKSRDGLERRDIVIAASGSAAAMVGVNPSAANAQQSTTS